MSERAIIMNNHMARPRSEDKRHVILKSAVQLFAEEGLSASTSRIAKGAGVAEGTIFTYFPTKDDLINQLYLELKGQLHASILFPPGSAGLRERIKVAWHAYVNWGMTNPQEYQVLARLGLSTQISEATRAEGNQFFCDVATMLEEAMVQGTLRHQSLDFVATLMGAMADATITFARRDASKIEDVCNAGFSAFWNAVTVV